MKALTAALVLIAASSGLAQAGEEKPKAPTDGQYIDVSAVALPVIVDGLVRNYVFVAIRVDLTSSANTSKLREKEPYFRDAVVRAAHRTPFNKPGDLNHIDETRLISDVKP
jgi:flagellar basal body-associated protein FliL